VELNWSGSVIVKPWAADTTADVTSTPWRPAFAIAESSGGMVASAARSSR
jgi:hypothetical protein